MPDSDHQAILNVIAQKAQKPLELPLGATALLVIDVQQYFMQPDGRLAKLGNAIAPAAAESYQKRVATQVLPNVERLVNAFRDTDRPLFFTGVGTRTGDGTDLSGCLRAFDEISRGAVGSSMFPHVNDADWQIHDAVAPSADETVLQKTTTDPFVSTELEQTLRGHGVTTVVVCGVLTDACVSSTARGAADRNFDTIVVEDACATMSEALHRSALEIIGLTFGRVATTGEILAALQPIELVTSEVVPG